MSNYAVQMSAGGIVRLYARSGGSWFQLQSVSTPGGIMAGIPYKLKVKVSGAGPVTIDVSFQGSALFSYTDSVYNIAAAIPGMVNYYSNMKYDYFTVTTS